MSTLLPLFLKLEGRRVVVVGGGPVAASKAQALHDAGAQITVVAPEVHPDVLPELSRFTVVRRAFVDSDLDGAWLVVAAAIADVNRQVSAAADARRIFCNAVDDPQSASAYMGGVVRRGGATVAISTDGSAPALAGLLREGLEAVLPQELDQWLSIAREERHKWRAAGVEMKRRRPLLLEALNEAYR
jgi:uroporphyrin-III C-methyltransferase/precorrin-2 dehydrogenase/sirohydrochlorin ferrochelatase